MAQLSVAPESESQASAPACRVSIIVPAYGRTESLRAAVGSLLAQDLEPGSFEVLVVDSSPVEDNARMVEELQGAAQVPLRLFRKRPEGPGPSRNLGAAHARAEIVAFMDSDCQAHPTWLRRGLAAFAEGVGLVQGRTLPDPAGARGVFTWCPTTERENFVYECTNLFYRRRAFEETGGFPADMQPTAETPMGGEDVEVAWKVKSRGWHSRFADDAVVYHEVVPISLWRWIFHKRLFIWPRLVRKFPELRRFLVLRVFWDRGQALLALALAGVAFTTFISWAALLALPYAIYRGAPASKSFPGILRPLRILPYLARDASWLLILFAGSIRYRSLVL